MPSKIQSFSVNVALPGDLSIVVRHSVPGVPARSSKKSEKGPALVKHKSQNAPFLFSLVWYSGPQRNKKMTERRTLCIFDRIRERFPFDQRVNIFMQRIIHAFSCINEHRWLENRSELACQSSILVITPSLRTLTQIPDDVPTITTVRA